MIGYNEASSGGVPAGNTLRGPNAGTGNNNGGGLTIQGGFAYGSGTGGTVTINGGSTGSGTAGSVVIGSTNTNQIQLGTATGVAVLTAGVLSTVTAASLSGGYWTASGTNIYNNNSGSVIIGAGEGSSSPSSGTLRAPNVGSGTNVAGASLNLSAGYAYGNLAGGNVNITGGTTGTGANGSVTINPGNTVATGATAGSVTINSVAGGATSSTYGNTYINPNGGNVTIGTSTSANQLTLNNGMNIDQAATNNGTLSNNLGTGNGLIFGSSSGEGIASNRANSTAATTTGNPTSCPPNQYGVDIYTNFVRRLSVTNAGYVGIGGYATITGSVVHNGIATQMLDVFGANAAPAASGTTSTAIVRMENNTGNGNVLDMGNYNSGTYGTWMQATDRSNLGTTYPIDLNPNGGNIGIGMGSAVTPYQSLTITNASAVYGNSETGTSGLAIETGQTKNTDWILYMGADKTNSLSYIQSVQWGCCASTLALNARGGGVGVGLVAPAQTLDVNGNVGMHGAPVYETYQRYAGTVGGTYTLTAADLAKGVFYIDQASYGTIQLPRTSDVSSLVNGQTIVIFNSAKGAVNVNYPCINYNCTGSSGYNGSWSIGAGTGGMFMFTTTSNNSNASSGSGWFPIN